MKIHQDHRYFSMTFFGNKVILYITKLQV